MDESDHDMVHTITQQIRNMFSPLMENKNRNYQQLAHQMGRIADFFNASPTPLTLAPNIPQGDNPSENRVVENNQGIKGLDIVLVQRNQDVDQVIRQVR